MQGRTIRWARKLTEMGETENSWLGNLTLATIRETKRQGYKKGTAGKLHSAGHSGDQDGRIHKTYCWET
jgi:hypothetical protein